jgi:hypothetical protein
MSESKQLSVPIVHLNGTSREQLIECRMKLYQTLQVAYDDLRQMTPNGRDYYPAGPEAMEAAIAQHRRRQQVIADLMDEIEQEIGAIENG